MRSSSTKSFFTAEHSNLLYALENAISDEAILASAKKLRDYRAATKDSKHGDTRPTPQEAIDLLSDSMNIRVNLADYGDAISADHPTLQQKMFGLFFSLIKRNAETGERWVDGRNRAAHETCKKITDLCEKADVYLGEMPFI